jgi:hypothetical protein
MLLTNFVTPQLPKPAVVVDESARDISLRTEDGY